jgi:hypothetical protein
MKKNASLVKDQNNNELFKSPGNTSESWRYLGFYMKPECQELEPVKKNLDTLRVTFKICCKTYSNKGSTPTFKK